MWKVSEKIIVLPPTGTFIFPVRFQNSLSTYSTTSFPDKGASSQRNAGAATVSFSIVETELMLLEKYMLDRVAFVAF